MLAATCAGAGAPTGYELVEIVITKERPRAVERITTVDVVTSEQIARSGARTVDEAIALLPGLQIRRGAEGVPLVDIRGLRTRNVLLLLDGVPLNSSFDGLFDPATLSARNIAYIKLTRGASSTLYGPGGNAGVLNIVTANPGELADASVGLEVGSPQSSNLHGQVSFRRGDLGVVVSGSAHDQDYTELSRDFEPTALEDGGRRLNSDRRDRSASAKVSLDLSEDTRLGVNLNYRTVLRGKPPVTEDFRTSDFAPAPRFERVDQDALSIHAAVSHVIRPNLTLRPALYFNQTSDFTTAFDDAGFSSQNGAGAFREDATTSTLGAAIQLALSRGAAGLATLAMDLREERWDATGFTVVRAGSEGGGGGGGGARGAGNAAPVAFDDARSARIVSLALEYELAPDGPFSAVFGAGYAAQSREEAATESDLNLLLGAGYALGASNRVRASVARQIRFPTLRDLYGVDRGNPGLSPERTRHYEIAFEHGTESGNAHWTVALFRTDADDFIQRTPGEALGNTQQTRLQGIEIEGGYRPTPALGMTWSYTYLDAENRSPGAEVATLQNQPEHKLALTAEYAAPGGLRVRGDMLWVANSFALSRSGPTRVLELGDYAVLGLTLSRRLRNDRLRVIGRVSNLLDENYAESIGFPAPGRTLTVGIELRSG